MSYDFLIVGAGFAGATMARLLADAGKRVLIVDKRDHIGGNAYDYTNEDGVRVHKYGPHIFHTNSDAVFAFLSRFTEWRPYEHRVLSRVCILGDDTTAALVPFPINLDTIRLLYGLDLDEDGMKAWIAEEVRATWPEGKEVVTAEDQCLSTIGVRLYETFFRDYTTKMWGVTPDKLDKSVTARIPLRFNRDDRYFTDKHQAMPKDGYAAMFERMLDHPGIEVALNSTAPAMRYDLLGRIDLLERGREQSVVVAFGKRCDRLIWTGPIDEYFSQCFGPLPYRSLRFETTLASTNACNAATINYPDAQTPWTRATQWAVLAGADDAMMTPETNEFPSAEGEPYYPIPCPEARALYKRYEALADREPNVIFLGRLARYQYLNMDQVVGQALAAFARMGVNPAR